MKTAFFGALSLLMMTPLAFAQAVDPFAPFLGKAPPIVRELGTEESDGVMVRRVVFYSRTAQTPNGVKDSQIFAAIARPKAAGKYPGLLVLHGGGGSAEIGRARAWAARGYIVIAPDLPGVANASPKEDKVPLSSGAWKGPYGADRFVAPVENSTIFDGVLSALQSLYLLRAQPDVDTSRIGVTGISWGGYTATMVAGLAGRDVHAVFSVYGSGFYDRGSTFQKASELGGMKPEDAAQWLRWLDAGRRAPHLSAAYFVASAANDNWFYPSAVMATLNAVSGPRDHLFAPNASHAIPLPGGTKQGSNSVPSASDGPGWLAMENAFFDWHLKNQGAPLLVVTLGKSEKTEAATRVRFRVRSAAPVQSAQVFYSLSDAPWPKRKWLPIPALWLGEGRYQALIPLQSGADWFALVSDTRPVTVASDLQKLE